MRLSPGMSTPSRRGIIWFVCFGNQAEFGSALFLFVARVFANDANDVLATHDLACFAQSFD